MNLRALLAVSLVAGPAFAAEITPWPMPSPIPTPPPGVETTTYPMPRIDWLVRTQAHIEGAAKMGDAIELIFDGDSITDGWQGKAKPIWAERYGKYNAFDFGIAGDRVEHLLWRLSQGQAAGLHPKLIAIMIGTNNMFSSPPEQIADGVKAVVERYREICPDAVILLQGIFPRAELPTDPLRAKIKAVNKIISKLGDGKKVVYIDFGDKFLNADGALSPDIMPDFLHPSVKGYQIWADAIQPVIDKYLAGK